MRRPLSQHAGRLFKSVVGISSICDSLVVRSSLNETTSRRHGELAKNKKRHVAQSKHLLENRLLVPLCL